MSDGSDGQDGETCKGCVLRAEVKSSSDGSVDRVESCCRWKTLELPAPLASSGGGYAALKQNGEEWLSRVVAMYDTSSATKEERMSDGQELWDYGSDYSWKESISDSNQIIELQESQSPLCEPRRMQCDWCERFKPGEEFLYHESSKLLKKMIRANAQVVLRVKDVVVPNVFESEWGRELYDIRPTENSGELQQLLLPFDLVRDDDAKVVDAPSKLVSIADSYLHSLQRTDISLTRASMNIPYVWNHAVALNGLANLVAEELKTVVTQPKSPVSSSSTPVPLQAVGIGPKAVVTAPPVSLSAQRHNEHNGLLPEVGLLPSTSAKLAVTAEDSHLSTDYFMSDKFLKCNWSEVPEEINSIDVTPREDVNSNYSKEPLKYDQLLQQIARPALWDLMRKKLLQVDGTSFQRALNRVSLETLEAIIYQQFREVKEMSLNPSAFSSIEIVEACASLRQAAWLHTLR